MATPQTLMLLLREQCDGLLGAMRHTTIMASPVGRTCFLCPEQPPVRPVANRPCHWHCSVCDELYYSCETCADGWDWYDNDKGILCLYCERHWCAVCRDEKEKIHYERDGSETWCHTCHKQKRHKEVIRTNPVAMKVLKARRDQAAAASKP